MTVICSTACFPPSPAAQANNQTEWKRTMRRPRHTAIITVLALLASSSLPTSAQQRAPAPPPAAPVAAQASGPSFQSGGLKATVTSVSAQGGNVSLAMLLENRTQENLMVSVIGPPLGTNGGNVYDPLAVGGISYCIYNPANNVRHNLERTFEINGCLKGDKPQLTPGDFTLIDAGNAVPMNIGFQSAQRVDLTKDFSFSMNVAVFKESEANTDSDNPLTSKSKEQKLPKSFRYISVGIPSLLLSQK
jgi:hypothetical protein